MDTETLTTLIVLLLGGVICALLHFLIGVAQHRLVRLYSPPATETTGGAEVHAQDGGPSIRGLILEWLGNGLRTLLWLCFVALVMTLLPHTRTQVESVSGRLRRQALHLLDWVLERGLNIIIIAAITIFVMRFAAALIRTIFILMKRTAAARDEAATQRRLQTLSAIFSGVSQSAIFFIGLMTLLQQLHVNVTPILASAGVVGIAVGFGAQSLIRDLFSGFLILLEDQFSVGDIVKIGEYAGMVEQITLRATRIRGVDGALTTIPNGNIVTVSNLSKDWSRVVLDIDIDYTESLDEAMQIAVDTATALRHEKPLEIIEDPVMLGVDKMSNVGVTLRILLKTAPAKQFDLTRELRRRIKIAFDTRGIRTPMAVQQIVLADNITLQSRSNLTGRNNWPREEIG